MNTSIHNALVDLLGKPLAEVSALCIPIAIYSFPGGLAMHGGSSADEKPVARCASWVGTP